MPAAKIHRCILSFTIILLHAATTYCAETIEFSWALLKESETGLAPLTLDGELTLHQDDALQFFLHPQPNTYLYIILNDSEGNFIPIFPVSSAYYDAFPPGKPVMVPEGGDRFTIVPPPGQERFILLASPHRLFDLEALMERCLRNHLNLELQMQLSQNVKQLRRSHSKMTQITEKGVPVSGVRRNIGSTRAAPLPPFIANQVTANNFYSRILRLNHE